MLLITLYLNYEYMKIIFQPPWRLRLLGSALVMWGIGLLWMRKIINIEV
jgi:Flp pilus assembly protein TadB